MANDAVQGNEMLVLTDENGNTYAIPREVVERHRVTADRKAAMERELGEDVSGYSMYQQFMNQQLASYHQAEARQAAAESRMARTANAGEAAENGQQAASPATGLRGVLVGVWRSLRFAGPASS